MAENRPPSAIVLFVRISRPLFLLGAALVYALGAGVADYLGVTINWGIYFLGQAWVTALQLGGIYLYEYYNAVAEAIHPVQNSTSDHHSQKGLGRPPVTMLFAAAGCLTAVASLSVVMIRSMHPSPETILIMGLAALGVVVYSVPPLRLAFSGYGELAIAILIANLVPAFAFLLQVGELHRLLAMTTFPLTFLLLALALVSELEDYASDIRHDRRTLMVRVGWQRGMNLHNGLILGAYLLVGLALTFGMPIFIGLPALLPLPLGILQIWQMRRIADGSKPNWRSLRLSATVLFGITAYLLMFAYWTR
jgi:1,4-dihydroxy-2-naphthoate octaprenyltransferase